jgi:uncharacterized OsmC-like protein
MAEFVYVHQSNSLETMYQASFSRKVSNLETVEQIHELPPYGLMLVSLGSCTAMVVNTFTKNNNFPLEEVGIQLKYERVFNG